MLCHGESGGHESSLAMRQLPMSCATLERSCLGSCNAASYSMGDSCNYQQHRGEIEMRALRNIAIGGAAALLALGVLEHTHSFASGPAKSATVKTVEKSGKYMFSPNKVTVKAGTTITFTN